MIYQLILLGDVLLFAAVCIWYVRTIDQPLFHPIGYYLLFHFLVFVFRPILAYYYDFQLLYGVYGFQPDWDVKQTALLTTDLALLAFCATAAWRTSGIRLNIRTPDAGQRALYIPSFLTMCMICAPVGLYALVNSFNEKSTGIQTMVADAATGFTVNTSGVGYLHDTQLMIGPITVLLVWLFRFRWWSFAPFAVYLILKSGTGGRWPVVMACLSLSLLYVIDRPSKRIPLKLVIALILMYLGFQAVGNDRGQFIRSQFQSQTKVVEGEGVKLKPMESMDWGNMEFLEYLVWAIPQRTGTYSYFLDNLQVFTEPVPRILWPGKPIGPPIQRFSLFKYGTPVGMTQSVAGAGWSAMGWIGVAIWASFFGLVMGTIYAGYARSRMSLFATAAFIIFLPMTITQFRDGSLVTILKQSLFTMLPLIIWSGLSRYFYPVAVSFPAQTATALVPRRRGIPGEESGSQAPAGGYPQQAPGANRRTRRDPAAAAEADRAVALVPRARVVTPLLPRGR